MQPLDCVDAWHEIMHGTDASEVLTLDDQNEWNAFSFEDRFARLKRLLEAPIDDFSVVYRWYFRMKWIQALHAIAVKPPVSLLEIGSGDQDMIPQILSRKFMDPDTSYVTANMNKKLTASLLQKVQNLPVRIDVIEDEAQNICEYIGYNMLDVVVFEHSVNDVLQAMLGERAGIDTTNEDWWHVLPRMIEIIKEEYQNNTLEKSVKDEFLSLIRSCMDVLKPGGYIIINHFMYQYDLNLGYHPGLWENLLPIVRKWVHSVENGTEEYFSGFHPQWWMFFKKV